jgi:hypothetical protein
MQAAWFTAALLATGPLHLVGAMANGLVLSVHVATAHSLRRETARALAAFVLGLAVEAVQQHVGGVRAQQATAWPPLWLLSLWPVFASSMMAGNALAWLTPRPALAALLGALFGPVSYCSGARLGALELSGTRSLVTLSACWAVAMPILTALSRRLDTESSPAPAAIRDETRLHQ